MLVEFHVTLQGFENWFIEQNNTYISNTFWWIIIWKRNQQVNIPNIFCGI
jgi:hypothetical protein